jgi:hypothetical protein
MARVRTEKGCIKGERLGKEDDGCYRPSSIPEARYPIWRVDEDPGAGKPDCSEIGSRNKTKSASSQLRANAPLENAARKVLGASYLLSPFLLLA